MLKHFHSLFSAKFWRHCALRQNVNVIYFICFEWEWNPQNVALTVTRLCRLLTYSAMYDILRKIKYIFLNKINKKIRFSTPSAIECALDKM